MSSDNRSIKPAAVPLSHKNPKQTTGTADGAPARAPLMLALAALLVVVVAISAMLMRTGASSAERNERPGPTATAQRDSSARATQPEQRNAGTSAARDEGPAPFAASQIAIARKNAQTALATFVERQIELKEQLDVERWGKAEFDAALAMATAGDDLFVKERFDEAQEQYERAADALATLIDSADDEVERLLEAGGLALTARDAALAKEAFENALAIAPDNPAAAAGLARAEKLPEVAELERKARNQALADNWRGALTTYRDIETIDPETSGLPAAITEAEQQVQSQKLREALSAGFAALEARRYSAAKAEFNKALKLEPGNDVARGGLKEIEAATVINRLARLEREAAAAVEQEAWDTALERYDQALALDGNIAFARTGKPQAERQLRSSTILRRIIDNPQKLSSDSLLASGREELDQARALSPRGPKLEAQIARVASLLKTYATPVPVRLTSDNRTEVLLSSVGELGRFATKELSLRPGEYTVQGSRAGCRDVRTRIVVRPNMAPVDIRCQDEL
ncbi:MAG: hypothetical protein AAGG11_17470 [Pseudomonadota bacterium]